MVPYLAMCSSNVSGLGTEGSKGSYLEMCSSNVFLFTNRRF